MSLRDEETRATLASLLVDSVIDYAIFVLDPEGHVRSWNPGAQRLKGYTAEQIIGKHFSTFYPEPDRVAGLPHKLLAEARREGRVEHRGWRQRRDGTRFFGQVTITALRSPDGELLGFAKVTRDLTEAHEHELGLERALQREREAAAELTRLNELRTAMLAAIAHDLTTPVTVIRSIADILATDAFDDPEEPRFLAERVRTKADELAALVEQLRDFSRLERGRIKLEREPLDLRALATALAADLAGLHDDVVVEVQMDADVVVEADRLAVTRILTNLLTNAISFSPDGGRVRVLGHRLPRSVQVGVADEGPGLDPAVRDRIFDEFWQGSTAQRRTSGGLGLGLSIVRQYATLHGGAVWVDSEPGAGATFWVELPTSSEA